MPNLTGLEDFAAPFVFDEQPTTLPADLRPTWRVALLTVTLRTCRGGRSSLQRLHVLNWALRSAEGIDELRRVLQGMLPQETLR